MQGLRNAPGAPALQGSSEQRVLLLLQSECSQQPQLPGPWPNSPEGARTSLSECQHSSSREPWDRSLSRLVQGWGPRLVQLRQHAFIYGHGDLYGICEEVSQKVLKEWQVETRVLTSSSKS